MGRDIALCRNVHDQQALGRGGWSHVAREYHEWIGISRFDLILAVLRNAVHRVLIRFTEFELSVQVTASFGFTYSNNWRSGF